MLRLWIILIASVTWSSSSALADSKYRGRIWTQVVEPNGHLYSGFENFGPDTSFVEGKGTIYISQKRGQKLALRGGNLLFDNSKATKYHMVVKIIEGENERYKAEIKFYYNSMEYDEETQDHIFVSKLFKKASVSGVLNSRNKFTFVDDNKPNLRVSLNIDKVFNKEEILARLKNNR